MSEIKLNKPQRKFIEAAVGHFGIRSYDVRRKELMVFAEKNDLPFPITALKKCAGDIRGHYNLTISGIFPQEKEKIVIEERVTDTIQLQMTKKTTDYTGLKPYRIKNPVYVIMFQGDVVDVFSDLRRAYNSTINILHDNGLKTQKDVEEDLKYTMVSEIRSNNSIMACIILKKGLL